MKTYFFQESFQLFLLLFVTSIALGVLFPKNIVSIVSCYIILLLFFMFFYREEERKIIHTPNLLSVCDGKVVGIAYNPIKKTYKIIVFLNIFDQHHQYYPTDAIITNTCYKKGTFHPAYLLKKSKYNERMITSMMCPLGSEITITQIAGQIARRIVNHATIGKEVKQGKRMGMIKLSSRVDVEFSSLFYQPCVKIGQKIYAKKTIIAIRNE